MPRDYSLTGAAGRAVPLDDFDIESRMDGVWWKPTLPRQEMRAFMERTDGPALAHFGLWFVLLAASGTWAGAGLGNVVGRPRVSGLRDDLLVGGCPLA